MSIDHNCPVEFGGHLNVCEPGGVTDARATSTPFHFSSSKAGCVSASRNECESDYDEATRVLESLYKRLHRAMSGDVFAAARDLQTSLGHFAYLNAFDPGPASILELGANFIPVVGDVLDGLDVAEAIGQHGFLNLHWELDGEMFVRAHPPRRLANGVHLPTVIERVDAVDYANQVLASSPGDSMGIGRHSVEGYIKVLNYARSDRAAGKYGGGSKRAEKIASLEEKIRDAYPRAVAGVDAAAADHLARLRNCCTCNPRKSSSGGGGGGGK